MNQSLPNQASKQASTPKKEQKDLEQNIPIFSLPGKHSILEGSKSEADSITPFGMERSGDIIQVVDDMNGLTTHGCISCRATSTDAAGVLPLVQRVGLGRREHHVRRLVALGRPGAVLLREWGGALSMALLEVRSLGCGQGTSHTPGNSDEEKGEKLKFE